MQGRLIGLAGLLAVAALGCGTAQAPPGPPAAGDAAQPRYGGVVNTRISSDVFDWDNTRSAKSLGGGQSIYQYPTDSLLRFKTGPEVGYEGVALGPEVAERWEISPDAKSFTFHLRKGVKWANLPPLNGRELTAADVKFSYEYTARAGEFERLAKGKLGPGQYDWMFGGLDRIETPDSRTAVVHFKEPFVPFLYYSASEYNPLFPREIFEEDGHFSDRLIGTGPFQYDPSASQKGTRWVLKKNPDYWEEGKPYLDQIRLLFVPDESAAFAAFQTKQVDILGDIRSPRSAEELQRNVPNVRVLEYYPPGAWRFYINTRRPPLDNKLVRQALTLGIDREEFIKTVVEGKGKLALDGTPNGLFTDEEVKKLVAYDPDRAKRLLAQAGFPNGLDLEVTFPGKYYGETYISALELLQFQLKKSGIRLNLISEDRADWSRKRRVYDYTLGLQGSFVMVADIDSWLYGAMYSKSKYNYNGVNDPKMDEMVLAQRREVDQAKRRDLHRETVRYMTENGYAVAIASSVRYEMWHPHLKYHGRNVESVGMPLHDSWVEK